MISEYRVSIDRFSELKESVILPTMEKMKKELEQDGWYCLIGDINLFDKFEIRKKMHERYSFASLSIVDIENRINQYVFVFLENGRVIISGDISSQNKNKSLTLTEVCEQ